METGSIQIENLQAQGFRNLHPLDIQLSGGTLVIQGANAQGKTNLLEALYVCATGKSFRSATARELLSHEAQKGRLAARFVRQGVRHEVEVLLGPRRRAIRVDGRGLRSTSKLLELVNVVAFFPDDLRIVKGSPEGRRRFLDRAIANHRADFVQAAIRYTKALKSRNALLRASQSLDRNLLAAYDEQLLEHGAVIHQCRQAMLDGLGPLALARFREVMQREASLEIRLHGGLPAQPAQQPIRHFSVAFAEALERSLARDRARGITHVGPHRGDLLFHLDGRAARQFASQGQQRALVLALKLAEVSYLESRLACTPVLLLDDVSSELDAARTRHLFEAVAELDTQVWISTTAAALLPISENAQLLNIHGGVVDRR